LNFERSARREIRAARHHHAKRGRCRVVGTVKRYFTNYDFTVLKKLQNTNKNVKKLARAQEAHMYARKNTPSQIKIKNTNLHLHTGLSPADTCGGRWRIFRLWLLHYGENGELSLSHNTNNNNNFLQQRKIMSFSFFPSTARLAFHDPITTTDRERVVRFTRG